MTTISNPAPLRLFSCSEPLRAISESFGNRIDSSDSLITAPSYCLIIARSIGHVVLFKLLYVGPTIHLRSPGWISFVSSHIRLR